MDIENGFTLDTKQIAPTTVRGKPVVGKTVSGILNNRSRFSSQILSISPLSGSVKIPDNNSDGVLYLTRAFGAPAAHYMSKWKSTSAYCFTYFQWGESAWARAETGGE